MAFSHKYFDLDLVCNTTNYYNEKDEPKMKFGKKQINADGSPRLRKIQAPVQFLKLWQRQICYHLQRKELPDCMYGSIEGRNNIQNVLQHLHGRFFLTIDLKNFFTNITNNQIHKIFMELGYPWEKARILTKITTLKGSLPQGSPCSPVLANFVFAKTALQIQEFIRNRNITFTTFLDDLTFSSSKDFKHLVPGILAIVRSNNFYPHHKKIHYRRKYCEVTGLIVGCSKLRLVPEMKKAALENPRVDAYVNTVKKQYGEHLMYLS